MSNDPNRVNEPQAAPPPDRRARLTSWIVIGTVVIGGLIYLSTQRQRQLAASAGRSGGATTAGSLMTADEVAGLTAPDWTLKQLNGQPLSLAQFKGRPVVLDFWASWCGPCKEEIPSWKALETQYASRGLVIIGVSEDDTTQDARNFLAKNPLNYPVVMDQGALAASWGMPFGLPTTFFIRRDGTIAARVEGLEEEDELQQRIQRIL